MHIMRLAFVWRCLLGLTILGTASDPDAACGAARSLDLGHGISAHLRFLFEQIRLEIRQYFFEEEKDGFSRDKRAVARLLPLPVAAAVICLYTDFTSTALKFAK